MKYITGRNVWLLAVSCWLLAACSSDGTNEQRAGSVLQVTPYITAYQNHDALSRRAGTVSPNYNIYSPTNDLAIGLFVLPPNTTQSDDVKLVRYNNGTWHSQIMVETLNYTICGYMPKKDPITATITTGGNVVLTLSDIPAVIADDVCFVTGIKDGKDEDDGDLLQGNFTYGGNDDNNHICLLMDHLFASVKFNFSVDAEYSALRTIKLKKMVLSTTNEKVTATITLTPNTTGADPVSDITYSPSGTTSSTATFFEDEEGIDIKTEAATICDYFCNFAPGLSNNLTLVSTYDVYDRYGNKIRKDCEATNKLPNLGAVRGECWTINLNVAPTYLGQLSEQDLDNPTITIN